MTNIAKHPLLREIYDLCLLIERFPACDLQSDTISAASRLLEHLDQFIDELAKERLGHEDAHRQADKLHEYAGSLEDQLYAAPQAVENRKEAGEVSPSPAAAASSRGETDEPAELTGEIDIRLLAAIVICRDHLKLYGVAIAHTDSVLRDASAAIGELRRLRIEHLRNLGKLERAEGLLRQASKVEPPEDLYESINQFLDAKPLGGCFVNGKLEAPKCAPQDPRR